VRAFESWIGVDNKETRARAPTLDADESGPETLHKCPSCGKTYTSIEDLSTHLVLRHPGEPVPLPSDSGISDRKVCQLCGKWYQLERDLQLHVQKRHNGPPPSAAARDRQRRRHNGLLHVHHHHHHRLFD
jgi:uncharacterized C2H2 Zn-finger protein